MNEKQPEEIMRQIMEMEKELKTIKSRTERPIPVDRDRSGKLSVDYTLKDWLQKLNEEVDEVKYDAMEAYGLQDVLGGDADYLNNGQKENIAEEICDVITVLYSMANWMGIDGDFLDKAMHECNEKNRRRGYHE